jgi:CBS-domain-containing membrane protein
MDNETEDIIPRQLVNLIAIKGIVSTIRIDGENAVMAEWANENIADFKKAQKLIAEAESILKQHIIETLKPFNVRKITGEYCTISLTKPRQLASKYKIDAKHKDEVKDFMKEQIVFILDDEKIEAYKKQNGYLPNWISESIPGEGGLSIRVKDK